MSKDQTYLWLKAHSLESGDVNDVCSSDSTEIDSKVSIVSSGASDRCVAEVMEGSENGTKALLAGRESDQKKIHWLGSAPPSNIDRDEIGANQIFSKLFSALPNNTDLDEIEVISPRERLREPPGCCNVGHHWGCYMACCIP